MAYIISRLTLCNLIFIVISIMAEFPLCLYWNVETKSANIFYVVVITKSFCFFVRNSFQLFGLNFVVFFSVIWMLSAIKANLSLPMFEVEKNIHSMDLIIFTSSILTDFEKCLGLSLLFERVICH